MFFLGWKLSKFHSKYRFKTSLSLIENFIKRSWIFSLQHYCYSCFRNKVPFLEISSRRRGVRVYSHAIAYRTKFFTSRSKSYDASTLVSSKKIIPPWPIHFSWFVCHLPLRNCRRPRLPLRSLLLPPRLPECLSSLVDELELDSDESWQVVLHCHFELRDYLVFEKQELIPSMS